jgi:hypothetical protein
VKIHVTTEATATIRELWTVDVPDAVAAHMRDDHEHALTVLESSTSRVFVDTLGTDNEHDRRVVDVE